MVGTCRDRPVADRAGKPPPTAPAPPEPARLILQRYIAGSLVRGWLTGRHGADGGLLLLLRSLAASYRQPPRRLIEISPGELDHLTSSHSRGGNEHDREDQIR